MTDHAGENTRCLLVAEYVDEAEIPADPAVPVGEVVRPHIVASYLDYWSADQGIKDFTVLLKDNRMVTVRGHSLRIFPPTIPGESGSYGVVIQSAGEEVLVALFKILEVIGIFSGKIGPDRKTA